MKIERYSFFGQAGRFVSETDFVRVQTERDQLQRLLNERDDEVDRLRQNDRRYRLLRDRMAIEDFPADHPDWSTPAESESVRIDQLCDAALSKSESSGTAEALADAADHAAWVRTKS